MRLIEYEIEGVMYGVTSLQAGAIEALGEEDDKKLNPNQEKLIKKTAIRVRDKDEPLPKEEPGEGAAKQGATSTADAGGGKK